MYVPPDKKEYAEKDSSLRARICSARCSRDRVIYSSVLQRALFSGRTQRNLHKPRAHARLRTRPVSAPGSPGSRLPWGCPRSRCRAQGARSVPPPMDPSGARVAGARAGEARGARRRRRRRRRRHRGERSLGTERAYCGRARALTARIPARDLAGAAGGSGPAQRPASGVRVGRGSAEPARLPREPRVTGPGRRAGLPVGMRSCRAKKPLTSPAANQSKPLGGR